MWKRLCLLGIVLMVVGVLFLSYQVSQLKQRLAKAKGEKALLEEMASDASTRVQLEARENQALEDEVRRKDIAVKTEEALREEEEQKIAKERQEHVSKQEEASRRVAALKRQRAESIKRAERLLRQKIKADKASSRGKLLAQKAVLNDVKKVKAREDHLQKEIDALEQEITAEKLPPSVDKIEGLVREAQFLQADADDAKAREEEIDQDLKLEEAAAESEKELNEQEKRFLQELSEQMATDSAAEDEEDKAQGERLKELREEATKEDLEEEKERRRLQKMLEEGREEAASDSHRAAELTDRIDGIVDGLLKETSADLKVGLQQARAHLKGMRDRHTHAHAPRHHRDMSPGQQEQMAAGDSPHSEE